jgi:hypothetical protein
MYDYTKEFNKLAQYGGHHMDSDAKKVELYRKGLNIQLQDRLVQNLNLSYNDLASIATDQEGTMRACEVAKEKKRKRTVVSTSVVPGKPLVVLAAVAIAVVHPCSIHSTAPGGS